jgi:hypothetical protein
MPHRPSKERLTGRSLDRDTFRVGVVDSSDVVDEAGRSLIDEEDDDGFDSGGRAFVTPQAAIENKYCWSFMAVLVYFCSQ